MNYEKLLIWQYKDKPKALATVKLISDEFKKSLSGLMSIPKTLDIETAEGVNLDVIGRIVGQSRVLTRAVPRSLFAFKDTPSALGFNIGKWYRMGDAIADSVVLDDIDFRFFIKCRVTKNYQYGTMPEIINALRFIFGSSANAYDQEDMTVTAVIPEDQITEIKKYAILNMDILPRPITVGFKVFVAQSKNPFGFTRSTSAKGFGVGKFARIIQ